MSICPNCGKEDRFKDNICEKCKFSIMEGDMEKEPLYLKEHLVEEEYKIIREYERLRKKRFAIQKDHTNIHSLNQISLKNKRITGLGITKSGDYINEFIKLKNLRTLNFNFSNSSDFPLIIPEEITNLKNLEDIDMGSCSLSFIPLPICKLKSLKKLDLRHNYDLTEIPDEIGGLNTLETLDLDACKLKALPNTIKHLKSIKYLNLKANKLEHIPDEIGDLKTLVKLNLRFNKLKTLPESIGNLENLEWLNIGQNYFKSLPDSIGNLKSLKVLKIHSIDKLTILPETLGNLSELIRLELWGNNLEHIPDSIGKLVKLEELTIWGNNLTEIPDSLGNLSSLKKLGIWRNPFSDLPISLKNLDSLLVLRWAERRPRVIPRVLYDLKKKGVVVYPSLIKESDKPFEGVNMTLSQIREFLFRLAGEEGCQWGGFQWRCGPEFKYAKLILSKMNISQQSQNKLLEICKNYGGYCDCEILMNAASRLLGEDAPF